MVSERQLGLHLLTGEASGTGCQPPARRLTVSAGPMESLEQRGPEGRIFHGWEWHLPRSVIVWGLGKGMTLAQKLKELTAGGCQLSTALEAGPRVFSQRDLSRASYLCRRFLGAGLCWSLICFKSVGPYLTAEHSLTTSQGLGAKQNPQRNICKHGWGHSLSS